MDSRFYLVEVICTEYKSYPDLVSHEFTEFGLAEETNDYCIYMPDDQNYDPRSCASIFKNIKELKKVFGHDHVLITRLK